MDAVEIGAYLTVAVSIVIVVYMFIKGYQLINKDPDKK